MTPQAWLDVVHLDADQHDRLGRAMAEVVAPLLRRAPQARLEIRS